MYISHLRSSVDPDSFGSLSVCSSQIRLLSLENSNLVYYKNKAVFYFYLNINIFSIGRYRSSTFFVAQVSEIEKIVQEVEKEKEEEAAAKKKDTKEK